MAQEKENSDNGFLLFLITIAIIIALVITFAIDSFTNGYERADSKARIAVEMFDYPKVVSKFILNDTVKTTYEHISIIENCKVRDSVAVHVDKIPSRFIALTVGVESGKVRFYSLSEKEFNINKVGEYVTGYFAIEIDNPINCN